MKPNMLRKRKGFISFLFVAIIILSTTTCKPKNSKSKIFLDYSFGMTYKEYKTQSDSLFHNSKITGSQGKYFTYLFSLPNGNYVNARYYPYFENGFLAALHLEFGRYGSGYEYSNFRNSELTEDVQGVLQLYIQKYGNPEKAKGWYADKNEVYEDVEIWKWDLGDFEIKFFPGETEDINSPPAIGEVWHYNYGGKIDYELKSEIRDNLNRKKAETKLNDL